MHRSNCVALVVESRAAPVVVSLASLLSSAAPSRGQEAEDPVRARVEAASEAARVRLHVPGVSVATYPEMATAGLWTTPSDLCRFALAIQDVLAGRRTDFLKPANARAMVTPRVPGEVGLGLFLRGKGPPAKDGSAGPSLWFGHDGWNEGFRGVFLACRDQRLAVEVMTNSDGGGPLGNEIVRLVQQEYGWPIESNP